MGKKTENPLVLQQKTRPPKNIEKCRPLGRPKDIRGKIVKKDGEKVEIPL